MHPLDKQAYLERYDERLARYGYDPRTLGWGGGIDRQHLRFRSLLEIQNYCDKPIGSILDVGCGFGDLYGYLTGGMKQDPTFPLAQQPAYLGVDINPTLLEKAREVYPEINVSQRDILDQPLENQYDVVVASGIFNARLLGEEQYRYIEAMLVTMFSSSRLGISIDFMTTDVDWQAPGAFHANPTVIWGIARKISPRVVLRQDYLPYEFCVNILRPVD